jgi:prepilin-type N-terminal cleavage/methylation domain-containing protein
MMAAKSSKGVTLAELMVVVAILVVAVSLTKLGVDWMVSIGRQRVLLEAQWKAQVSLYEITRNVRNCKQIVAISPGRLELAVFRPRETDGFSNPAFVVTAATGTLIYEFKTDGSLTFLEKTYTTPAATLVSRELVNVLEAPSADLWMFKAYGIDEPGKYEAVEVMIRLRPAFYSKEKYDKPIEYRTVSMKRTAAI